MDHLDVVARAGATNPVTAGLALDLGSGLLEDVLDVGPSGGRATGHERGAVTGTLLTTRDTRADEKEALGLELEAAAGRVGVVRVTTVNDDVALVHVGEELSNEVVDGLAGLDKKDDTAGALELGAELLNRVGANDVGAYKRSVDGYAVVGLSSLYSPLASFSRKWSTLEVVLDCQLQDLGERPNENSRNHQTEVSARWPPE